MNIKNNITLIGRIGNDLEIKNFENNGTYLRFSIAVDDSYFNKEKEKVERVYWHNCYGRNQTAEFIERNFAKGDLIALNGKLTSRTYTDDNGVKTSFTEVEIETVDITLRVQKKEA